MNGRWKGARVVKKFFSLLFFVLLSQFAICENLVKNVSFCQLESWPGLVQIDYELTEDSSADNLQFQVSCFDQETGKEYIARTFTTSPNYLKGFHRLIWNAKVDGVMLNSSSVFISIRTRKFYNVNFNANSGWLDGSYSSRVERNGIINNLPVATRNGYKFLGWFTSLTGGTRVSSNTIVTSDATYYAHWQKYFDIRFSSNSGTIFRTVVPGDMLGDLPTPSRSDYIFSGWYTSESGGYKISSSTVPQSDTTYYARWTKIVRCSLEFWIYDYGWGLWGCIGSSNQPIVGTRLGDCLIWPGNGITQPGHAFIGWFTEKEGGTQVDENTIITGDKIYYAHFR